MQQRLTRKNFKRRNGYNTSKKMYGGNILNKYDEQGQTPLFKAILVNNIAKVDELLDKHVLVNEGYKKDLLEISPLYKACELGYVEIVQRLLRVPEIDINKSTSNESTPLFIASANNHTHIVSALLAKEEIDVNKQVYGGFTALYVACEKNYIDIVDQLLAHPNIDVNLPNNAEVTPLIVAIYNRRATVVMKLVQHPTTDVNKSGLDAKTPLYIACEKGFIDAIEMLLERENIDINKQNNQGISPLLIACQLSNLKIVTMLLAKDGIDVNTSSITKITPLTRSVSNKYTAIVEKLLQHPAIDVNKPGAINATPLYIACQLGYVGIVDMLLSKEGVDINKATDKGLTPVYIAAQKGFAPIVQKILEHPKFKLDQKTRHDRAIFSTEIIALLDAYLSKNVPLWPGFSKSDSEKLGLLFEERTHPTQLTSPPINAEEILYSHCPICLKYISHGEATCMYMSHNCADVGGFYHESLFNKYKHKVVNIMGMEVNREVISWCTLCGRICKGHQHYKLDSYSAETPVLLPPGAPYESDCRKTNGGGGWPEKAARHRRLREYALELNEQVGKIATQDALEQLVEEMWNAPLRREGRVLGKMEAEKKFNISSEEFPNVPYNRFPNAPNTTAFQKGEMLSNHEFKIGQKMFKVKNDTLYTNNSETMKASVPYQYYFKKYKEEQATPQVNIAYPNSGNPELIPKVYSEAPEGYVDPMGADDNENVIQLRHRMANGVINTHENPATDMISKDMLFGKISSALNNGELEKIGPCWKPECTALLYPQELKAIIETSVYSNEAEKAADILVYERYRYEFNKKYRA